MVHSIIIGFVEHSRAKAYATFITQKVQGASSSKVNTGNKIEGITPMLCCEGVANGVHLQTESGKEFIFDFDAVNSLSWDAPRLYGDISLEPILGIPMILHVIDATSKSTEHVLVPNQSRER